MADGPMPTSVETVSWQAHPAKERLGAAGFAVVVIAAMAWLAYDLMQSLWWAVLAIAILLIALNRFFWPTTYRIDAEGIIAQSPWRRQQLRWSELRRFVYDRRGGYLSTRKCRSVLDVSRGMHVLFGTERDVIIARIRELMNKEGHQTCDG